MGQAFDDAIHAAFYRFGLVVHRHRLFFFLGSLLFAFVSSLGLLFLEQQTTIDPEFVFSPAGAPWRFERAVLSQHWPLDEQDFWPGKSYDYTGYVDVLVAGKMHDSLGRPNILHTKYLDEIDRINKYIINNISVPVVVGGKKYEVAYTDLCMTYRWKCYLNDHLTMLMPRSRWGNFSSSIAEFAKDIILKEVNITYPIGWRGSEPIYFGALVGMPRLTDEEGHFNYASAVRLTYNTREQKIGNISRLWRQELTRYLTDKLHPPSDILEFGMYHNESLPEGLQDVADALTPKFAGTVTILFTFCFIVSVVLINHGNGVIGIDWVRSKPIVVTAGLFVPLISIPTAFGLILWTGALYNAIVNVSPFLVLCIGIDDLFVMSAAWHRTNPEKRPEIRIAETLQEAAVAISVTSVTDVLTFAIGIWTPLPAVRMFCLYACIQCLFTYLFQLTFFSPVLAYAAEMEARGTHSLLFCRAIHASDTKSKFKMHFLAGSVTRRSQWNEAAAEGEAGGEVQKDDLLAATKETRFQQPNILQSPKKGGSRLSRAFRLIADRLEKKNQEHEEVGEETLVNRVFREFVAPFLLERTTQVCAALIYLVFISGAIIGIVQIKEGLSPKFLVRESFYLADFYKLVDETLWQEGLQMQIVVNNPPDLSTPEGLKGINDMVAEFEDTEYTMKANATMFWLRAYERHLQEQQDELRLRLPNGTAEWYQRCREWLVVAGGRALWEKDMVWGTGENVANLLAFRLQIGLRNYRTPTDHTFSCRLMREIASRFQHYNVTTFHEYYPFADQYLALKPSLVSNFLVGLSMMLAVSLVMIPDWRAACAVVLAVASINIGVLGYMTFWGVHLDSVSMITVIMCIGFAVDLSAHIAYAYAQASGDPRRRVITALEELGWPVFLGATSTILGIMTLILVDAYIIRIFFKTVFLVISFSMLHGLLFLPILLMIIIPNTKVRKNEVKSREAIPSSIRNDAGTIKSDRPYVDNINSIETINRASEFTASQEVKEDLAAGQNRKKNSSESLAVRKSSDESSFRSCESRMTTSKEKTRREEETESVREEGEEKEKNEGEGERKVEEGERKTEEGERREEEGERKEEEGERKEEIGKRKEEEGERKGEKKEGKEVAKMKREESEDSIERDRSVKSEENKERTYAEGEEKTAAHGASGGENEPSLRVHEATEEKEGDKKSEGAGTKKD